MLTLPDIFATRAVGVLPVEGHRTVTRPVDIDDSRGVGHGVTAAVKYRVARLVHRYRGHQSSAGVTHLATRRVERHSLQCRVGTRQCVDQDGRIAHRKFWQRYVVCEGPGGVVTGSRSLTVLIGIGEGGGVHTGASCRHWCRRGGHRHHSISTTIGHRRQHYTCI